jgi:hypothetical protein
VGIECVKATQLVEGKTISAEAEKIILKYFAGTITSAMAIKRIKDLYTGAIK